MELEIRSGQPLYDYEKIQLEWTVGGPNVCRKWDRPLTVQQKRKIVESICSAAD